jgi:nitrate reductase gamma subunit
MAVIKMTGEVMMDPSQHSVALALCFVWGVAAVLGVVVLWLHRPSPKPQKGFTSDTE